MPKISHANFILQFGMRLSKSTLEPRAKVKNNEYSGALDNIRIVRMTTWFPHNCHYIVKRYFFHSAVRDISEDHRSIVEKRVNN